MEDGHFWLVCLSRSSRRARGGQGILCSETIMNCFQCAAKLLCTSVSMLRNDLKSYETGGTGAVCFDEKVEKSTAIQV